MDLDRVKTKNEIQIKGGGVVDECGSNSCAPKQKFY